MRHALGVLLLFVSISADAALVSRLGGQAYYDDALNITWLTDTAYSKTSGYDSDGFMTWQEANEWIDILNSDNYLGSNNWRLPNADINGNSQTIDCTSGYTQSECADNELMYHSVYNDVSYDDLQNFIGLERDFFYWSSTVASNDYAGIVAFDGTTGGSFGYSPKSFDRSVWVVMDGDIGASVVPIPAAVWLFGSGLGLLGWFRRRQTA